MVRNSRVEKKQNAHPGVDHIASRQIHLSVQGEEIAGREKTASVAKALLTIYRSFRSRCSAIWPEADQALANVSIKATRVIRKGVQGDQEKL